MIVTIREHHGEYEVWVALTEGDPAQMTESFCIGVGADYAEAFAHARKTMAQAFDDLVVLANDRGVEVAR